MAKFEINMEIGQPVTSVGEQAKVLKLIPVLLAMGGDIQSVMYVKVVVQ